MPVPGTRADSLRVLVGGVEMRPLAVVGTLAGVVPLVAAGANGPGTALLASDAAGARLRFRAPGSAAFGAWVPIPADGEYLLEDGDAAKWLRVEVVRQFVQANPLAATVYLADRYGVGLHDADVEAGDAAAGLFNGVTLVLENVSSLGLSQIKAWLSPDDSPGLEITVFPNPPVAPTSEETALELGDLKPGETKGLFIVRTITAGAPAASRVLNHIHFSFHGL